MRDKVEDLPWDKVEVEFAAESEGMGGGEFEPNTRWNNDRDSVSGVSTVGVEISSGLTNRKYVNQSCTWIHKLIPKKLPWCRVCRVGRRWH
jgi:hypothetical protein